MAAACGSRDALGLGVFVTRVIHAVATLLPLRKQRDTSHVGHPSTIPQRSLNDPSLAHTNPLESLKTLKIPENPALSHKIPQ